MEDPLETSNAKITHCRFCGVQKISADILDLESDYNTYKEIEHIFQLLKIDFVDLSKECALPKSTCESCYDTIQEIHLFFHKINSTEIQSDATKIKKEQNDDKSSKIEEEIESPKNNEVKCSEPSTSDQNQNINKDKKDPQCTFCKRSTGNNDQLKFNNDTLQAELKNILNFFKMSYNINSDQVSCKICYDAFTKGYNYLLEVKNCQKLLKKIYETEKGNIATVKIKIETQNSSNIETEMDKSWTGYIYVCSLCQYVFKSMNLLRTHSKDVHSKCNTLKCADCGDQFNTFTEFVEHVRDHRNELRLYCQYCNEQFSSILECDQHVNTHYIGTCKICDLCGEVLPYANTLEWHKKFYGKCGQDQTSKSWEGYDWCCQECETKFAMVSDLRAHIQAMHGKCFAMRCMDCNVPMKDFKGFVAHVTTHRPHLKHYCQFCDEHFNQIPELNKHLLQHITSQRRPCMNCGQIFNNNLELANHKERYSKKPVTRSSSTVTLKDLLCYPSQLQSYSSSNQETTVKKEPRKRRRKAVTLSSEDLTCQVCGKLCDNITKFKRHVKTHDANRPRKFVCKVCKKAFITNGTLVSHMQIHSPKNVICQICGWKFHTKHRLKHHLVTHSEAKPFVCDECGNSYKTKRRLKCHLESHSNIKPFKCVYCGKEFRLQHCMKTHELQHTGVRPYSCEVCDRTFTNWTNCNKHMIRRHGVTLAKTKITPHGRLSINRRTGETKTIATDEKAKEWMSSMLKPEKPGKKRPAPASNAPASDSSE